MLVRTDLEQSLDRQPTVDIALAAARIYIIGLNPIVKVDGKNAKDDDDADEKLLGTGSPQAIEESEDPGLPGTFRLQEITLRDNYPDNDNLNESHL